MKNIKAKRKTIKKNRKRTELKALEKEFSKRLASRNALIESLYQPLGVS